MRNKKFFIIALLMVVVLIGVGYANITNRTLEINGTATATPDAANFKVRFLDETEEEIVTAGDGQVEANVIDDDSAEFTISGLTTKGQAALVTYTIKNESNAIEAALSAEISKNTNPEHFDVDYYFGYEAGVTETSLRSNETETVTVIVTLKTTPVDADLSSTIKLDITAAPEVELERQ